LHKTDLKWTKGFSKLLQKRERYYTPAPHLSNELVHGGLIARRSAHHGSSSSLHWLQLHGTLWKPAGSSSPISREPPNSTATDFGCTRARIFFYNARASNFFCGTRASRDAQNPSFELRSSRGLRWNPSAKP
jgi:hypothetical protein